MSFYEALHEDLKWLWLTCLVLDVYRKQIEEKGTFTHTNSLKVRTSRRAVLKEFKGECFAPFHLLLRSCAPKVSKMMLWEPAGAQKSSKFRKASVDINCQMHTSSDRSNWDLNIFLWSFTWRSEMPLKDFSHLLCLKAADSEKRTKKVHKLVEGPNFPKGRTRGI